MSLWFIVYSMDCKKLTDKKSKLDKLRPLPPELTKNLEEWLKIELTYTSNAIEGNTLTRRETALVIEKGLTIGKKTLKEHLEATNHGKALDYIMALAHKPIKKFSEEDLLKIHEMILHAIDDDNAGKYRKIPVRIAGSPVVLANPQKVYPLMDDFLQWLRSAKDLHPVELASLAHYKLVTIHPFVDGNGRTARLLMNLILIMKGYPPAIIRKEERLEYISALEQAQLGGSILPYYQMIHDAVERSLDLYLKSDKGLVPPISREEKLLKIGELSKMSNVSVPTIRVWMKKGLLTPSDETVGGFYLFSKTQLKRIEKIKELKKKRQTLDEIKKSLL